MREKEILEKRKRNIRKNERSNNIKSISIYE